MSYCLNPQCPHPANPGPDRFCIQCGSRLLLGDRYRALKPIGEKGAGRTFFCVDESDPARRNCAIKQVALFDRGTSREGATHAFLEEAMKLQALGQHPQIPQLWAYFESDGGAARALPILVQEWIVGQTLEGEIYGEAEIKQLLDDLLPVLQFIHESGIIHRDLNPKNLIRPVVCSPLSPLFLVDFSTAKVTAKSRLAQTGTLIGSAAYSAPEQLRGKATFASDLYSLGVSCVHWLTGMHPFELLSSLDGIGAWRDYLAVPVGDRLGKIIDKMLAEAVRDRYQSAAEIYQDLHAGQTLISTVVQTASEGPSPPSAPQNALFPSWRCFCTLTGHRSSINAIAFHPEGQILASGSADRTVKLWDLRSNLLLTSFSGPRSIVAALLFTPDGETLIAGSWDYTIRLWQGEREVGQLSGHSGWVQALAVSPDGKILASGSSDRSIKLWDLASGEESRTLSRHSGAVCSLAVSPDGKILASGSSDRAIKLWELASGEESRTLTGHSDPVESLAFSPSGQLLASGSSDRAIKLWDLAAGKAWV